MDTQKIYFMVWLVHFYSIHRSEFVPFKYFPFQVVFD